jgi:hypothetical protein
MFKFILYYIMTVFCLILIVIRLVPKIIFVQNIHKSYTYVYYSLLKSIDLTNRKKAFKYLATSSLFVGGQIPPLVVMCCIIELLWGSSMLHT